MSAQLEKQIVSALASDPPPTLDRLLRLVADTEAAIITADKEAEHARAAFYDPVLTPDVHIARDAMERTQFTAQRLRTLLPRLQDKAREVEAAEARAEWRTRFEALERERDKLAAELRQTYPKVVSQLVDLFARIAANDATLSQLHQSRPSNAKGYLKGAELTARGLEDFTRDTLSLVARDRLQLPDWIESNKFAWPPPTERAAVLVAGAVSAVHDPRRYSSEWPAALREETDRRRAEEAKAIEAEAVRTAAAKLEYEKSLPR